MAKKGDLIFGWGALLASVSVVLAILIWTVSSKFPVLADYPEWVYHGYILSGLFRGLPQFATSFGVHMYPVPNSFCQLVLGIATTIVADPVVAAKIVVLFYCLLCALFAANLMYNRQKPALAFVFLVTFAFNGTFWNGFLNFQFGLVFLGFYVDAIIKETDRGDFFHLTFSLLTFFSHFTIYLVWTGFYCAWYVLPIGSRMSHDLRHTIARSFSDFKIRSCILLIPSLVLTTWYLIARAVIPFHFSSVDVTDIPVNPGTVLDSGLASMIMYKGYTLMKLGPFQAFQAADGNVLVPGSHIVYWIGILGNGIFAVTVLIYLVTAILKLCFNLNTSKVQPVYARSLFPRALSVTALVIVVLLSVIIAPQMLGGITNGITNIGERLLIAIVFVLFLTVPPQGKVLFIWSGIALIFLPVYAEFMSISVNSIPESSAGWSAVYFIHRPYSFLTRTKYLLDLNPKSLPPLGYPTSLLYEKRVSDQ